MTGARAGSEADAEFVEFVTARQQALFRGAYLVTGDASVAQEALLAALSDLAGHWGAAREERPDTVAREALYRPLLSAAGRRRADGAVEGAGAGREPGAGWEDPEERERREVLDALTALTPEERTVLVLRVHDERTAHETGQVLGRAAGGVDDTLDAARSATDVPLTRDALELASDDIGEVDLAEAAWDRAARRRRAVRRRVVLGVAGVTLAGTAVALVRRDVASTAVAPSPAPSTTPTASVAADGTLPFVGVDGIRVSLAPEARDETGLPPYPDAEPLALPPLLTPGDDRPRAVLDPDGVAGVEGSVRAVFLVHGDGGGYNPVVFVPAESPTHFVVPSVQLGGSGGANGDGVPVLGARTISEDRHRLLFVQPGALVVLDTRDATTTWIDVPDPTLVSAGWARDGVTVIARGATESWVVDTASGAARPAEVPVGAEWVDLVDLGSRSLLRSFSGSGELTDSREMRGPGISPTSPPVANTEGWVAVGASIPAELSRAVARDQGLVVVQGDLRPTPRILAAAPSGDAAPYRAVAWGPRDVALLESLSRDPGTGSPVRRLLAWDVIGGTLWLASELEPESPDAGGFTGSWAI